jgi:hypothetical protein
MRRFLQDRDEALVLERNSVKQCYAHAFDAFHPFRSASRDAIRRKIKHLSRGRHLSELLQKQENFEAILARPTGTNGEEQLTVKLYSRLAKSF